MSAILLNENPDISRDEAQTNALLEKIFVSNMHNFCDKVYLKYSNLRLKLQLSVDSYPAYEVAVFYYEIACLWYEFATEKDGINIVKDYLKKSLSIFESSKLQLDIVQKSKKLLKEVQTISLEKKKKIKELMKDIKKKNILDIVENCISIGEFNGAREYLDSFERMLKEPSFRSKAGFSEEICRVENQQRFKALLMRLNTVKNVKKQLDLQENLMFLDTSRSIKLEIIYEKSFKLMQNKVKEWKDLNDSLIKDACVLRLTTRDIMNSSKEETEQKEILIIKEDKRKYKIQFYHKQHVEEEIKDSFIISMLEYEPFFGKPCFNSDLISRINLFLREKSSVKIGLGLSNKILIATSEEMSNFHFHLFLIDGVDKLRTFNDIVSSNSNIPEQAMLWKWLEKVILKKTNKQEDEIISVLLNPAFNLFNGLINELPLQRSERFLKIYQELSDTYAILGHFPLAEKYRSFYIENRLERPKPSIKSNKMKLLESQIVSQQGLALPGEPTLSKGISREALSAAILPRLNEIPGLEKALTPALEASFHLVENVNSKLLGENWFSEDSCFYKIYQAQLNKFKNSQCDLNIICCLYYLKTTQSENDWGLMYKVYDNRVFGRLSVLSVGSDLLQEVVGLLSNLKEGLDFATGSSQELVVKTDKGWKYLNKVKFLINCYFAKDYSLSFSRKRELIELVDYDNSINRVYDLAKIEELIRLKAAIQASRLGYALKVTKLEKLPEEQSLERIPQLILSSQEREVRYFIFSRNENSEWLLKNIKFNDSSSDRGILENLFISLKINQSTKLFISPLENSYLHNLVLKYFGKNTNSLTRTHQEDSFWALLKTKEDFEHYIALGIIRSKNKKVGYQDYRLYIADSAESDHDWLDYLCVAGENFNYETPADCFIDCPTQRIASHDGLVHAYLNLKAMQSAFKKGENYWNFFVKNAAYQSVSSAKNVELIKCWLINSKQQHLLLNNNENTKMIINDNFINLLENLDAFHAFVFSSDFDVKVDKELSEMMKETAEVTRSIFRPKIENLLAHQFFSHKIQYDTKQFVEKLINILNGKPLFSEALVKKFEAQLIKIKEHDISTWRQALQFICLTERECLFFEFFQQVRNAYNSILGICFEMLLNSSITQNQQYEKFILETLNKFSHLKEENYISSLFNLITECQRNIHFSDIDLQLLSSSFTALIASEEIFKKIKIYDSSKEQALTKSIRENLLLKNNFFLKNFAELKSFIDKITLGFREQYQHQELPEIFQGVQEEQLEKNFKEKAEKLAYQELSNLKEKFKEHLSGIAKKQPVKIDDIQDVLIKPIVIIISRKLPNYIADYRANYTKNYETFYSRLHQLFLKVLKNPKLTYVFFLCKKLPKTIKESDPRIFLEKNTSKDKTMEYQVAFYSKTKKQKMIANLAHIDISVSLEEGLVKLPQPIEQAILEKINYHQHNSFNDSLMESHFVDVINKLLTACSKENSHKQIVNFFQKLIIKTLIQEKGYCIFFHKDLPKKLDDSNAGELYLACGEAFIAYTFYDFRAKTLKKGRISTWEFKNYKKELELLSGAKSALPFYSEAFEAFILEKTEYNYVVWELCLDSEFYSVEALEHRKIYVKKQTVPNLSRKETVHYRLLSYKEGEIIEGQLETDNLSQDFLNENKIKILSEAAKKAGICSAKNTINIVDLYNMLSRVESNHCGTKRYLGDYFSIFSRLITSFTRLIEMLPDIKKMVLENLMQQYDEMPSEALEEAIKSNILEKTHSTSELDEFLTYLNLANSAIEAEKNVLKQLRRIGSLFEQDKDMTGKQASAAFLKEYILKTVYAYTNSLMEFRKSIIFDFDETEKAIHNCLSSYNFLINKNSELIKKLNISLENANNAKSKHDCQKAYQEILDIFIKDISEQLMSYSQKSPLRSLRVNFYNKAHTANLYTRNRLNNLKKILENFINQHHIKIEYQAKEDRIMALATVNATTLSSILKVTSNSLKSAYPTHDHFKPGDELRILAMDVVYLDTDLEKNDFSGVNIRLIGPKFLLPDNKEKFSITTDGFDGEVYEKVQAENGANGGQDPEGNGLKGGNGKDGLAGRPGGHAGNIYIIAGEFPAPEKVFFSGRGGNGSPGQLGGNGGNGGAGKDGSSGSKKKAKRNMYDLAIARNLKSPWYDYYSGVAWDLGTPGKPGGNGGDSGHSGYGGDAGNQATISIKVFKNNNAFSKIAAEKGQPGTDADVGHDLFLMSELPQSKKPELGKLYLEKKGDKLKYVALSPAQDTVIEAELDILAQGDLTKEFLSKKKSEILEITLKRGHTSLVKAGIAGKSGKNGKTCVIKAHIVRDYQIKDNNGDECIETYNVSCLDGHSLLRKSGFGKGNKGRENQCFSKGRVYFHEWHTYDICLSADEYFSQNNQNEEKEIKESQEQQQNGKQNGLLAKSEKARELFTGNQEEINQQVISFLENACSSESENYQSWQVANISVFLNQFLAHIGQQGRYSAPESDKETKKVSEAQSSLAHLIGTALQSLKTEQFELRKNTQHESMALRAISLETEKEAQQLRHAEQALQKINKIKVNHRREILIEKTKARDSSRKQDDALLILNREFFELKKINKAAEKSLEKIKGAVDIIYKPIAEQVVDFLKKTISVEIQKQEMEAITKNLSIIVSENQKHVRQFASCLSCLSLKLENMPCSILRPEEIIRMLNWLDAFFDLTDVLITIKDFDGYASGLPNKILALLFKDTFKHFFSDLSKNKNFNFLEKDLSNINLDLLSVLYNRIQYEYQDINQHLNKDFNPPKYQSIDTETLKKITDLLDDKRVTQALVDNFNLKDLLSYKPIVNWPNHIEKVIFSFDFSGFLCNLKLDKEPNRAKDCLIIFDSFKQQLSTKKFSELFSITQKINLEELQKYKAEELLDPLFNLLLSLQNKKITFEQVLQITKKGYSSWADEANNKAKEKFIYSLPKERSIEDIIKTLEKDEFNASDNKIDLRKLKNSLEATIKLLHDKKKAVDSHPAQTNQLIQGWIDACKRVYSQKGVSSKEQQLYELVASVCCGWYVINKSTPRNTQIASLLVFLEYNLLNHSLLAQIKTGEGKTLIVGLISACLVIRGYRIDIVSSNRDLAIDGQSKCRAFLSALGISSAHNCDTEQQDKRKAYGCDVVYGEIAAFQGDILENDFNKKELIGDRYQDMQKVCLIVDEVDSLSLDKAKDVLYLSHNIECLKWLETVFVYLWTAVLKETPRDESELQISIEEVASGIQKAVKAEMIFVPKYLHDYVASKLKVWTESAFQAKAMNANNEFVLDKPRDKTEQSNEKAIIVLDKGVGVEQYSSRWSNGLAQFLELKFRRKLSTESLKAIFMSNKHFFDRYKDRLYGLTGTLGDNSAKAFIREVYGTDFITVPTAYPKQYYMEMPKIGANLEEWLSAIVATVKKHLHRPVLIITDTVQNTELISAQLKKAELPSSRIKCYARDSDEVEKHFQLSPAEGGDIIVATNKGGRGTDITVSKVINREKGGLHVILTYLPENERIEEQAFGRTSRNGNPGSGQFILLAEPDEKLKEELEGLDEQQRVKRLFELAPILLQQKKNALKNHNEELFGSMRAGILQLDIEQALFERFKELNQKILTDIQGSINNYCNKCSFDILELDKEKERGLLKEFLRDINHQQGSQDPSSILPEKIKKELEAFVSNILRDKWAFWLDSVQPRIHGARSISIKNVLIKQLEEAFSNLKTVNNFDSTELITFSEQGFKLAELFLKFGDIENARKTFELVKENDSVGVAYVGLAYCAIPSDDGGKEEDLIVKKQVRRYLKKAKTKIDSLQNTLSTNNMIAKEFMKLTKDIPDISQFVSPEDNYYCAQLENKLKVLQMHLRFINKAVGGSLESEYVFANGKESEYDKSKEIYFQFVGKNIIYHNRLRRECVANGAITNALKNIIHDNFDMSIAESLINLLNSNINENHIQQSKFEAIVRDKEEFWNILTEAGLKSSPEKVVVLDVNKSKLDLPQEYEDVFRDLTETFSVQLELVDEPPLNLTSVYKESTVLFVTKDKSIYLYGQLVNSRAWGSICLPKEDSEQLLSTLDGCDLCLRSELPKDVQPNPGKIYLEKNQQDKLQYIVLSPQNQVVNGELDISVEGELTKDFLNKKKSEILEVTSKRGHTSLDFDNAIMECFARSEMTESSLLYEKIKSYVFCPEPLNPFNLKDEVFNTVKKIALKKHWRDTGCLSSQERIYIKNSTPFIERLRSLVQKESRYKAVVFKHENGNKGNICEYFEVLLNEKQKSQNYDISNYLYLSEVPFRSRKEEAETIVKILKDLKVLKSGGLSKVLQQVRKSESDDLSQENINKYSKRFKEIVKDAVKDAEPAKAFVDDVLATQGEIRTYKDGLKGWLKQFTDISSKDVSSQEPIDIPEELSFYQPIGFHRVLVLEEDKRFHMNWSALLVFALGVLQVVGGCILCAVGAPSFGNALISEGVSDMVQGMIGMITGQFSLTDWVISKAISFAVSILTAGISAFKNLAQGAKNVYGALSKGQIFMTALGKACTELVMDVGVELISHYGIGELMSLAESAIVEQLKPQIESGIKSKLEKIKTELKSLRESQGEIAYRQALSQFKEETLKLLTDKNIQQAIGYLQKAISGVMATQKALKNQASGGNWKQKLAKKAVSQTVKFAIDTALNSLKLTEIPKILDQVNAVIDKNIEVVKQKNASNSQKIDVKQEKETGTIEEVERELEQLVSSTTQRVTADIVGFINASACGVLKSAVSIGTAALTQKIEQRLVQKFTDKNHYLSGKPFGNAAFIQKIERGIVKKINNANRSSAGEALGQIAQKVRNNQETQIIKDRHGDKTSKQGVAITKEEAQHIQEGVVKPNKRFEEGLKSSGSSHSEPVVAKKQSDTNLSEKLQEIQQKYDKVAKKTNNPVEEFEYNRQVKRRHSFNGVYQVKENHNIEGPLSISHIKMLADKKRRTIVIIEGPLKEVIRPHGIRKIAALFKTPAKIYFEKGAGEVGHFYAKGGQYQQQPGRQDCLLVAYYESLGKDVNHEKMLKQREKLEGYTARHADTFVRSFHNISMKGKSYLLGGGGSNPGPRYRKRHPLSEGESDSENPNIVYRSLREGENPRFFNKNNLHKLSSSEKQAILRTGGTSERGIAMSPYNIRFSQDSVNYFSESAGKHIQDIADDMEHGGPKGKEIFLKYPNKTVEKSLESQGVKSPIGGWQGEPIDVVKMPDGRYTSIDNRRLLAAREAGVSVRVIVHEYGESLPPGHQQREKSNPKTWGELAAARVGKQKTSKQTPYGFSHQPVVKYDENYKLEEHSRDSFERHGINHKPKGQGKKTVDNRRW